MIRSTLVWLLCGVVFSTASMAGQDGSQHEYIVPIKLYEGHLIVVRGGLGTLQDRNLLIDTGAYPSVIDSDAARKLKLPSRREEIHVLGRNLRGGASVLPQVEIGPLQVRNLDVVVEDLSTLSASAGVRVDALIGMDVLEHMNFRIDYDSRAIFFGAPAQLTFSAPLEWIKTLACVSMSVDGHPLHMLIDSGGAKTVLFARHEPWAWDQLGKKYDFANAGGRFELREVRADTVDLGDAPFSPEGIFVSDAGNMAPYPFDGFMATRGPHIRQVAFDFVHGVFSWETDGTRIPGRGRPNIGRQMTTAVESPQSIPAGPASLTNSTPGNSFTGTVRGLQ